MLKGNLQMRCLIMPRAAALVFILEKMTTGGVVAKKRCLLQVSECKMHISRSLVS